MRAAGWSWLVFTSLGAVPLGAQTASPYVPLHHWAMPYVEYLVSAGAIADPTPLTRPLRQSDLVRALEAADTARLGVSAAATVRRLLEEFRPRVTGSRYRIALSAGLAAASHTMCDPLEIGRGVPPRPAVRRGFASGSGEVLLAFGPFVTVTHPTVDTRLQYDPDWIASGDNATRWEEGYVSGQWRYGEAFFGILDRNWGPSGIQGILLSDVPYSMDHLYVSIGTERVRLATIATQLDPIDTGVVVNRYQIYHRLSIRPRGRWTVALWEASVLSGVGRALEPWYLNAATFGVLRQGSTGTNANSFVGFDVERRASTTLFGQFMLDDIQTSRKTATDRKPASYAFTLGAKGRGSRAASWMLFYTQVANLTYRNEDNLQVPLYRSLPTGRNFSDYDQATARVSWLARPGLLLEPEVTLLRQGEGDPRLPHPLPSAYPATATLFQGRGATRRAARARGQLAVSRTQRSGERWRAPDSQRRPRGGRERHSLGRFDWTQLPARLGARPPVTPVRLALLLILPAATTLAQAQDDTSALHTTLSGWADDALLQILDRDAARATGAAVSTPAMRRSARNSRPGRRSATAGQPTWTCATRACWS